MPGRKRQVYWDANLFLSYINGDADRLPTLDALVAALRRKEGDIDVVTSTLSITEVALGQAEQDAGSLDAATLDRIDALWADVKLIDIYPTIAYNARGLMRDSVGRGWRLKPPDAIHLATARLLKVSEFLTYDSGLYKYEPHVGLPVRAPYAAQPTLPLDSPP